MDFDWKPLETKLKKLEEDDICIRYLQEHYKKHKTINDITATQEVEFEGKIIKIGSFLSDCRKKHFAYTTASEKQKSSSTSTFLRRYQELDALEIDWRPSENTISYAKIARTNGLIKNTLKKYTEKFGGDVDKAIKICIDLRRFQSQRQPRQKSGVVTMKTVKKVFDVNEELLESLLNRQALKTTTTHTPYMYDDELTLRQYCIKNGLNYNIILKAVNLKTKDLCDESLESIITRCIWENKTSTQEKPSNWVYSKYGNEILINHLLMSMNLDPKTILLDMSKRAVPIESAIENNCFFLASNQKFNYLEPMYHELIAFYNKVNTSPEYTPETAPDVLYSYFEALVDKYHLTSEEFTTLKDSFVHYTDSIEQFHLYEVGFEKDPVKRVEKIMKYNLDEDCLLYTSPSPRD